MSLGLVGFTAVVAALRRPNDNLDPVDLFRSLHLLGYASATLLLSLFPFLLKSMGCEPEAMWQISSSAMLFVGASGFVTSTQQRSSVSIISVVMKVRFFAIVGLSCLNIALQLGNAVGSFGPPQFWPFLLGLFWFLIYCLNQFASLLFLRPSE